MLALVKVGFLLGWINSVATVFSAADVACTESGIDYQDGAHVLQVVLNRIAKKDWSRYAGKSKLSALFVSLQHAHGCKMMLRPEHLRLGLQYLTNQLPVHPWAKKALFYCGNYDRPGQCESYATVYFDVVQLGKLAHTFWGVQKRDSILR